MPDANDIVYSETPLNIVPFLRRVFEELLGVNLYASNIITTLEGLWYVWTILAYLLSFAFIFGIVYASIRYNQLSDSENDFLLEQERLFQQTYGGAVRNSRWDDVLRHIDTDNPNDWKLAIIEADILLEELLTKHGFAGTTIGEKLKSASPQSFTTLNDAWAAHRVRNQIAHGDADFVLTHKRARDAVKQYERVFTEFGFV